MLALCLALTRELQSWLCQVAEHCTVDVGSPCLPHGNAMFAPESGVAECHVGTEGTSCEAWLEGRKQMSGQPLWGGGTFQMNRSMGLSGASTILGISVGIHVFSIGSQDLLPLPHTGLHEWAASSSLLLLLLFGH